MPDYVRAMNNSKSLSGLETPGIYFVLSCTSTGLICATSISLSTKEFPSPCFHDWPGGQAWKLWQITGWLLELLFRASAQE